MENYILNKELKSLQFTVWNEGVREGQAHFEGNLKETLAYLQENSNKGMEVSAFDPEYMHSLEPVPAMQWLIWYYRTALTFLEENDFETAELIPYPSNSSS
ncbi:hypothetical protein ACG2F4_04245 [Halalkalibaculum sp. DA3122]|uniref:hypothetical protein n=1 Tax=Halalkalibaculum sp. DA3122 TaxID=3373607 RepID=UPI00375421D4